MKKGVISSEIKSMKNEISHLKPHSASKTEIGELKEEFSRMCGLLEKVVAYLQENDTTKQLLDENSLIAKGVLHISKVLGDMNQKQEELRIMMEKITKFSLPVKRSQISNPPLELPNKLPEPPPKKLVRKDVLERYKHEFSK